MDLFKLSPQVPPKQEKKEPRSQTKSRQTQKERNEILNQAQEKTLRQIKFKSSYRGDSKFKRNQNFKSISNKRHKASSN